MLSATILDIGRILLFFPARKAVSTRSVTVHCRVTSPSSQEGRKKKNMLYTSPLTNASADLTGIHQGTDWRLVSVLTHIEVQQ
jgi:hypothetical protein